MGILLRTVAGAFSFTLSPSFWPDITLLLFSLFVPQTFLLLTLSLPMLAPSTQDLHVSLSVPEDNASWADPLDPAKGLGALLWEKT